MGKVKAICLIAIILLVGCGPSEKDNVGYGEDLVKSTLKDPYSAKFESFFVPSGNNMSEGHICGTVNSKNSYGAYVGKKRFVVYIKVEGGELKQNSPVKILQDDDSEGIYNWSLVCNK